MKKIITAVLLFISFASFGQNGVDSTTINTSTPMAAKQYQFKYLKVDSGLSVRKRFFAKDSAFFSGKTYALTLPASGDSSNQVPNTKWVKQEMSTIGIGDTAGRWVYQIQKNSTGDSIVYYRGGVRYAVKDSIGVGSFARDTIVAGRGLTGTPITATKVQIDNDSGYYAGIVRDDTLVLYRYNGDSTEFTLPSGGGSGWGLTGNAGTTAGTNFIGTTDDVGLMFKINNLKSGYIGRVYENTALGYESQLNTTTNGYNTSVGYGSLKETTIGIGNTALGHSALSVNTTGSGNVAVGSALENSTTAGYNIAIGNGAMTTVTTGAKHNTHVGINTDVTVSDTDTSGAFGYKAVSSTRQMAFSPFFREFKMDGITGASSSGYVLTTDGSGIATFQAASGSSSVLTGNLAYVDDVNGNDGTGTLGDFTKPYLTLAAAKTAATAGYTIVVRPGTYTVSTSIAKDSVDWYFYPNTSVTMASDVDSTGIWDDGGTEMHFTVTGSGKFTRSTTDEFLAVNLINITNASSVINIEADELITSCGADGESTVVNQHDGNLTVNARIISALNGSSMYAIWWWNGTMNINATKIYSEYACIVSSVSGTPTGDAHVTANEIHAGISGNSVGVVAALGTNSDAAIWVHANTIRGSINSTSSNKVYVEAQKIFHRIITSAGAGLVYVTTDKITDIGSGVLLIEGGIVRLNVDHIDPSTFDGSMSITGGELQLNNANYIATSSAVGMTVSGGTARLTDCNFTTSANSGTSPLIKSGGILTIRDCILVAESTSTSISAPTSQTVISYNSFANKAIDSDVTINGILTIGSYVQ